jgi:hypothetical protein
MTAFMLPRNDCMFRNPLYNVYTLNPVTPELNPSTQRCLTRFFTWDFAS